MTGVFFVGMALAVAALLFMFKFLGPAVTRVTERMVTGHFQVAESLLERDELPKMWGDHVRDMASRGSVRRYIVRAIPWQIAARSYLTRRIQKSRDFFSRCPFVEDEETRKAVLAQFDEIKQRWENQRVEDILEGYNLGIGRQ